MPVHRAFAGDRSLVSQCVRHRLCSFPPFVAPPFCRERLCCTHKHVSSNSLLGHDILWLFYCTFNRTSIIPIEPQHMQGRCFGNRDPLFMVSQTANLMLKSRPGDAENSSSAHTRGVMSGGFLYHSKLKTIQSVDCSGHLLRVLL